MPSIILFSCIAYQLSLASMAKWSLGSHHTCHRVDSWSLSTHLLLLSHLGQGIPQGSVFGLLLFILYTTPLSSLISDSSIGHHMYTYVNQLFISFFTSESPPTFHTCKPLLILSLRMSSNLLSFNQSKTEFLLIGLPAQLPKMSYPSLFMPSNAMALLHQLHQNAILAPSVTLRCKRRTRNYVYHLWTIYDSTLFMSDHIFSVSKFCFLSIRDLRRIKNTLDYTTVHTIATSLIHSKLAHCNSLFWTFLSLNLVVLSSFSTLTLEKFINLQIMPHHSASKVTPLAQN